ncbi:MAG: hypothetical protein AABY15_00480 [Nanoarchaeota archaeon]
MSNIYWEEHNRPEESAEKKEVGTVSVGYAIELPKKNVGGYDITGNYGGVNSVMFMMTKKPKWFHRVCTRFFLGWNWVDSK